MKRVRLGVEDVLQAHETLAGAPTELGRLIARRGDDGAVQWVVPVTRETLHRIEGVYLLAAEHDIDIALDCIDRLDERESAFLEDFVDNRLASRTSPVQAALRLFGEGRAVLGDLLKAAVRARPPRPTPIPDGTRMARIVVIGLYGGDHVGDAAILGGVLRHMHETYGVASASVLSFRAHHTRRLVAGLDTPVQVTVSDYDPSMADRLLDGADALVIAGGPLMDLPRILLKHLAAIGSAQARGVPFIIERVGVGPFKWRASRMAARRIARSAALLSVRTSGAADDPILGGLPVRIGRDPAFDYLATRHALTLLTPAERQSVASLLEGTDGRLLVGINIRPIRHAWSRKGEDYSKSTEGRFFQRLADGLIEFSQSSARPVTYVFFPMNPIQFGASDLASAYRLHRLVGGAVDLRVWQSDPDVDGVIHLIRRLDIAITMRFHACIFALAQGMPVLGIDYYPGQGGKVEELFRDLEIPENVRRIDTLETDWLVARLHDCNARLVRD